MQRLEYYNGKKKEFIFDFKRNFIVASYAILI
jgi:hypothetical protein